MRNKKLLHTLIGAPAPMTVNEAVAPVLTVSSRLISAMVDQTVLKSEAQGRIESASWDASVVVSEEEAIIRACQSELDRAKRILSALEALFKEIAT